MNLSRMPHRITTLREARGMSKRTLSQVAPLHRNAVAALEDPERTKDIYLDSVLSVALALGVRPSRVLWAWPGGEVPRPMIGVTHDFDVPMFRRELCAGLRRAREALKIGPTMAAEISGIDRAWIYRLESGEYTSLNLTMLHKYVRSLKLPLHDDVFIPAEEAALRERSDDARQRDSGEGASAA